MNTNAPKPRSLACRATAAVLLMVGFYVLALGLVAGLIAVPIWEYRTNERFHPKVAIAFAVMAGMILWSVLPRRDKFPPPGVPLARETQPKLFDAIEAVARDTDQAMPTEVYLVPGVNAFVAHRGGVMGFFSRRVMGLGLPLLRVLDVDQMRAVLTHEFGHFHGGDTRLGPWVHETSATIGRTVLGLAKLETVFILPFRWYGFMFLRITQKISRAQEYSADQLAARVVGAEPLASSLQILPATAALYGRYLEREVMVVLKAGRRPPLAAGFQLFLQSDANQKAARDINAQAMNDDKEKPYETHPPPRLRIAALADFPARVSGAHDRRPAIDLLANRERIECELLEFMTGRRNLGTLPTIEWRHVGEEVVMKGWRENVARWSQSSHPRLGDVTLGTLPEHVRRVAEIGKACAPPKTHKKEHANVGVFVLAAAAGVALHDAGFTVDSQPGGAAVLERDGHRFVILEDVHRLKDGALDASTWQARCVNAGVAHLQLAGATR